MGCAQNKLLEGSSDLSEINQTNLKASSKTTTTTKINIYNNNNNTHNLNKNIENNNNIKMDQNKTTNELMPKSELSPNNRKKVNLGRGYSLMDWIRLTRTQPDLAGNNGVLKKITHEELAKHNRQDDCWLALFDKVYNITPYMKYHPGGIDELMKGAGKNATNIFNDVHPWVNFQNMLEKCLIGVLIGIEPTSTSSASLLSPPPPSTQSLSLSSSSSNETKIPNLDFYQTNNTVTVVLYTKLKNQIKKEDIIIEKQDSLCIVLFIYILDSVYKYLIDLIETVENKYDIKVTNDGGKIEIIFHKLVKHQWSKMNPKLNYKCELVLYNQTGISFKECELISKQIVTHDTCLYTFQLPEHVRMQVPIGYHVFLRLLNENLLVKPYTVICDSFHTNNNDQNDDFNNCVHLMIKHYENGEFTSLLNKLDLSK